MTLIGQTECSEVSLFQGFNCMQELFLGKEKVSLLERCPHFRGVLRQYTTNEATPTTEEATPTLDSSMVSICLNISMWTLETPSQVRCSRLIGAEPRPAITMDIIVL